MSVVRALFFVDVPHRLGGAQRSLLATLEQIAAHGVEPLVVFPENGLGIETYRRAALDVRVVPAPPKLLVFGGAHLRLGLVGKARLFVEDVIPYARRLSALIRDEKIQVAHFNSPRAILIGGFAAKFAGLPAVMHQRGNFPFGGTYWLMSQALSDRIVVVSKAVANEVYASARHKVRVVYNGVKLAPPTSRELARAALSERFALQLDRDETVFVSLSSPVPLKGLHHLVTAAAKLRAQGLRARFVCAGSGGVDLAYERWLRQRTVDLGVADIVHFVGYVPDPLALVGAADALVLTTVDHDVVEINGRRLEINAMEGFPRSILEAMSLGVPVVASRVGGVEEQIEPGVTGELVPGADPDALAAALAKVAGDPAWRASAGARAREVVAARFSVQASASGLAAVLKELARV